MKNPKQSELAARCEARLREFTAADSADLTEFAECRLIVHGISPCNGEDVTQRARRADLQAVLDRAGPTAWPTLSCHPSRLTSCPVPAMSTMPIPRPNPREA